VLILLEDMIFKALLGELADGNYLLKALEAMLQVLEPRWHRTFGYDS
jgi:hypothetical protein